MEAILASFLMLTAIIMSASVFDSSLQMEASNEQRVVAALVAESALAEIRDAANNSFTTVESSYNGRRWTIPEYPHHQIEASVKAAELAIPCSVLESQYVRTAVFPQPTGRYMTESSWHVEVRVQWANSARQSITVTELVTNFAPSTDFRIFLILPDGSRANASTVLNIAKDDEMEFTVEAESGGQPIRDIQFSWYVQALTGFGSISRVSRDGEQCIYQNAYRNFDNKKKYSPGACRLVVTASYQGIEATSRVRIENAE